jgi:hypothetical protein
VWGLVDREWNSLQGSCILSRHLLRTLSLTSVIQIAGVFIDILSGSVVPDADNCCKVATTIPRNPDPEPSSRMCLSFTKSVYDAQLATKEGDTKLQMCCHLGVV